MTITEFLEARYAEDEASADTQPLAAPWQEHDPGECDVCDHHRAHQARDDARYDRVLAEVAAKRQIIALHGGGHECPFAPAPENDTAGWFNDHACPTLRALAAVYADHQDYDQAWAL